MLNIPIIRLIDDAIIPVYAKPGDAGADLVAAESVSYTHLRAPRD